jgi:hypothetical protein
LAGGYPVPKCYQLAPQLMCKNNCDDGLNEPSGAKKLLGIVKGDQWLQLEDQRASRASEMNCNMFKHIVDVDLIVTWHDAGLDLGGKGSC